MLAIGLMSGTSLDGVDVCLVEILNNHYEIKAFLTYPYNKALKEAILKASIVETSNVELICILNTKISYYYIEAIDSLLNKTNYTKNDITFIASHGQTIYHHPSDNHSESSTLQIGDANILSYYYNTIVVNNFRLMDMAAGGCGAPLIPMALYELYHDNTVDIAYQNIGGIGNITYIPKDQDEEGIIAFDTGPGNMLIDMAMQKLFNKPFDEDGKIAKQGRVNEKVLNDLLNDDYFNIIPPKSTGREKYNVIFLDKVIEETLLEGTKEDVITTLTYFTSYSISNQIKKYIPSINKLYVSGGGAHNKTMMKVLQQALNIDIIIAPNMDSLEALGFVIIGYRTLNKLPSNIMKVTGAKEKVILGSITYPPRKKE